MFAIVHPLGVRCRTEGWVREVPGVCRPCAAVDQPSRLGRMADATRERTADERVEEAREGLTLLADYL